MERIVVVQLSDIHVGSIRNTFYSAGSLWSGLHGHHGLLMERLEQAFLNLRVDIGMDDDEPMNVVVSGDLTCVGLRTEYALAYTYLLGELVPDGSGGSAVGLHVPRSRLWAVPGNHDHWDGQHVWPQPAHDPGLSPDYFERTPWRSTLLSPGGTLRLHLFGIDSNSGMAGWSNNTNARGRLSAGELAGPPARGLKTLLQESAQEEQAVRLNSPETRFVRAVVCHHAFSNPLTLSPARGVPAVGTNAWKRFQAWMVGKNPDPLDPLDVAALKALCVQFGVTVVLTGHTHRFSQERHPPSGSPSPFLWELRCGTTLQGPPANSVQGFYVHEVRLDAPGSTPVWRYKIYQYTKGAFREQQGWSKAD